MNVNLTKKKRIKYHRSVLKLGKISDSFIVIGILFCSLYIVFLLFFGRVGYIDGFSMLPGLKEKDLYISVKTDVFNRYDVVIAKSPENEEVIKRVIATPGDTIEIKDNKLFVNNLEVEEFYIKENSAMNNMNKIELDKDDYFLMGDNRNNSKDGRYYGAVDEKQILEKVIFTFSPFN